MKTIGSVIGHLWSISVSDRPITKNRWSVGHYLTYNWIFRFGVCCVFTISDGGTSTSENCSYIQNPSYPSVYSATSSLTYTVEKCSDEVCAIRLDFETMTIAGPSATAETNGGECTDSFVVTGTSGITTPTICGKNTGAHIYIGKLAKVSDLKSTGLFKTKSNIIIIL